MTRAPALRRRLPLVAGVLAALVAFSVTAVVLASRRGSSPAKPAARVALTTDGEIAAAQEAIRVNPRNELALTALAGAALDKYRESGDPTWYTKADEASSRALAIDPRDFAAIDAAAVLANARHRFRRGLALAERSLSVAPLRFAPLGIAGDALVELGRYREGFGRIERRLRLRPDLSSYSRASYMDELQGDRPGAIQLMGLAVDAGRPGSEARAWTQVQLGLLRFGSGDLRGAEGDMRAALEERPGDARATAGLARVLAARGQLAGAAALYSKAIDRLPLPEYPAALADIHLAQGKRAAARDDLALVDAMQRLLAANGVRVDLDISLIQADFARPNAAAIARARAAYSTRPGIIGDDVLGWVLTRAGHCGESLRYARRSLRLGTRDALMLFHAGMAAACAGQRAEGAGYLRQALALNPAFSVRWAPVARATLRRLS